MVNGWTILGLFILLCIAVFVIILIVEIRTTLFKTTQDLEEIKKTLGSLKKEE